MKKIRKQALVLSVLFVLFAFMPSIINAQTTPGDPGGDVDAPIDGGVSLLVAAGIGYGVKKVRDNKKKKTLNFDKG